MWKIFPTDLPPGRSGGSEPNAAPNHPADITSTAATNVPHNDRIDENETFGANTENISEYNNILKHKN